MTNPTAVYRVSHLLHGTLAASERLAKATKKPTGKPKIPGDGDGDGIPNEGKNRGKGAAAGKKGDASLMLAASSKFSSLDNAKEFQLKAPKPTQVLQGEGGHFIVPPHARASGILRAAGHKVVLDYNGKPPKAA